MFLFSKFEKFMVGFTMIAAASIIGPFVWQNLLPKLDGLLFPVVGALQIDEVVYINDDQVRVVGHTQKNRECDNFVGIEFFFGPRGGRFTSVPAVFLDKAQVRDMGVLEWDKLIVDLDEYTLRTNSHADVIHRCYGGLLWTTRTPFYDGNPSYDRGQK